MRRRSIISIVIVGALSGLLAGLAMLTAMAALRIAFGWPTPTELIFDRLFPKLTVEFFIGSLVKAGGYTPLKLRGVYGAIAGQLVVASLGGIVYAWYRSRPQRATRDPRGWRFITLGVVGAAAVMFALLYPNTLTNFAGRPPAIARLISAIEMLITFGICGAALVFFYPMLASNRDLPSRSIAATSLRRFLALGSGAALYFVFAGMLRRLFSIGTFQYDGRQYGGPGVQKITPIEPEDQFYQVSKNLVDPMPVRDAWRFDITGAVENPRTWSFAEIAALPPVEQETTLLCNFVRRWQRALLKRALERRPAPDVARAG